MLFWNCLLYPLAGFFPIIIHLIVVCLLLFVGLALVGPYNIFFLDAVFLQAAIGAKILAGGFRIILYIPLLAITHALLIGQYVNVIVHSSDGEPRMPLFDTEAFIAMGTTGSSSLITQFGMMRMLATAFSPDNFFKYLRVFLLSAVCFLPLFAYAFFGEFDKKEELAFAFKLFTHNALPYLLISLPGMLIFPLALLAVSLHESLAALHPRTLFRPLKRLAIPYLFTCLVFYLPLLASNLLLLMTYQQKSLGKLLLVKFAAYSFLGVVSMHLLGGFYWCYKAHFGWFKRHTALSGSEPKQTMPLPSET